MSINLDPFKSVCSFVWGGRECGWNHTRVKKVILMKTHETIKHI